MQISSIKIQNYNNQNYKSVKNPAKTSFEDNNMPVFKGKIRDGLCNFLFNLQNNELKKSKVKDNIDFSPARTIDEAKAFAKESLLIDRFNLTNLDVANYVNGALSNYYNSSNDKTPIITSVFLFDNPFSNLAVSPLFPTLYVNENELGNIDSQIEKLAASNKKGVNILKEDKSLSSIQLSQNQRRIIEAYKNNPSDLSYCDKMTLLNYLQNLDMFSYMPVAALFCNLVNNNPKAKELLSEKGFSSDEKEFHTLPKEKQKEMLRILKESGCKLKINDQGPYGAFNHEIGHKLHQNQIGYKKFMQLSLAYKNKNGGNDEKTLSSNLSMFFKSMSDFMKNDSDWIYSSLVSNYSLVAPTEFVAETYALIKNGVEVDKRVMQLYQKYKGPVV